jgi:hypothetical protein
MRCSPHLKVWLLGVLVLAVGLMCGCGSGDNQTNSNPPDPPAKGSNPADESDIVSNEARIKGQNTCKNAEVNIGSKPGVIRFVAHCSGRRLGGVAFTLVDYSIKDGARLEINGYSQTPSVNGAGAVSRRGECSMGQHIVACKAKINGPAAISGYFWVDPEDRCSAEISLVGVVNPPCRSEYCSGAPRYDELFSNKPKGCGGASS